MELNFKNYRFKRRFLFKIKLAANVGYWQVKTINYSGEVKLFVGAANANDGTKFETIDNGDGSISIAFYESPTETVKLVATKVSDKNGTLTLLDLNKGFETGANSSSSSFPVLVERCPLSARFRCVPQKSIPGDDSRYFGLVSFCLKSKNKY